MVFQIEGSVELCAMTEQTSTSGTAMRRRQHVEPDPQRHQRGAEAGKAGDEAAGERAEKQQHVGRRGQSISPSSFRACQRVAQARPDDRLRIEPRIRVCSFGPSRNDSGGWSANIYTTRWAGTIAIKAFTNIHSGNVPMNPSAAKPFCVCHGAWSAGWAWKKLHPLMQRRRASAGHADLHRPWRARASRQSVDRSRDAHSGHAERHQI